jgi:hypothetical protein
VDLSLQEALEQCKCEQEVTRVYEAAVKEKCSGLEGDAYDACEKPHYEDLQKALDKCAGIEPSKCDEEAEAAYNEKFEQCRVNGGTQLECEAEAMAHAEEIMEECVCREEANLVYEAAVQKECSGLPAA